MRRSSPISSGGELSTTRALDQRFPPHGGEERDAHPDEGDDLRRAYEALRAAARQAGDLSADLDLVLDPVLGEVRLIQGPPDHRRVLRVIPGEEVLRLARQLRGGQLRLLDCLA